MFELPFAPFSFSSSRGVGVPQDVQSRYRMLRFAQGCLMAALVGSVFGSGGLLEEFDRSGKVLMGLLVVVVLALLAPSLFPDGASRQGHGPPLQESD